MRERIEAPLRAILRIRRLFRGHSRVTASRIFSWPLKCITQGLIANFTIEAQPVSVPINLAGGVHGSQAAASPKAASFLMSLMEVAGATDDAPAGRTPATASAGPRKSPKESPKEKDAAGTSAAPKSTANSTAAAPAAAATTASTPLLFRLLQFGLVIVPPPADIASGAAGERGGARLTTAAENRPASSHAESAEDFAANSSPSAEGAEPNSSTSSANLAFALRLTDSALTTAAENRSASSRAQSAEDFAANSSPSAKAAEASSPTSTADLAFAQRLTDSAAPPATNAAANAQLASDSQAETAAANAQPASDSHAEPPAPRSSSAVAINAAPPNAPPQAAPESGNQSGAQDANRNPAAGPGRSPQRTGAQQREDSASTEKAEATPPPSTLPAAAAGTTAIAAAAGASASTISQGPVKDAAPVAHTAPATETPERPAAAPAQHISLSVADSDNRKVEVHLMDRAGEVRVSVRSAGEELTGSMRADLSNLTGKLGQSGYTTESFAPAGASLSNSSNQRQPSDGRESTAGGRQNSQQNQSGGQQQPPRDGRGQRPAWVEELENSLAPGAANRSQYPWQRRA